jgi:hypothetical protein
LNEESLQGRQKIMADEPSQQPDYDKLQLYGENPDSEGSRQLRALAEADPREAFAKIESAKDEREEQHPMKLGGDAGARAEDGPTRNIHHQSLDELKTGRWRETERNEFESQKPERMNEDRFNKRAENIGKFDAEIGERVNGDYDSPVDRHIATLSTLQMQNNLEQIEVHAVGYSEYARSHGQASGQSSSSADAKIDADYRKANYENVQPGLKTERLAHEFAVKVDNRPLSADELRAQDEAAFDEMHGSGPAESAGRQSGARSADAASAAAEPSAPEMPARLETERNAREFGAEVDQKPLSADELRTQDEAMADQMHGSGPAEGDSRQSGARAADAASTAVEPSAPEMPVASMDKVEDGPQHKSSAAKDSSASEVNELAERLSHVQINEPEANQRPGLDDRSREGRGR